MHWPEPEPSASGRRTSERLEVSPQAEGEDLLPPEQTEPVVLVVRSAGYAELVLNRPARRNALTIPLVGQLRAGLAELAADPALNVVVVRGEGGCFCSGLDLDQLVGPANAPAREVFSAEWLALHSELAASRLLTIAALEGAAIAGGSALALACDFLVAGSGARLQVSEVIRGMTAPINLAWLLAKHGAARAIEMVLGAAAHDGSDLYRLGLANAVVDDGDVLSEARSLAVRLSGHSPAAVSATKAMIAGCWPLGGFGALVNQLKTASAGGAD